MKKKLTALLLTLALLPACVPAAGGVGPEELFLPFLTDVPPHITELIEAEHEEEGVLVRRVLFQADDQANIDLTYAYPQEEGQYPAVLLLHGGGGTADRAGAIWWAQNGYAVVSCDIPGLLDRSAITHTSGAFLESDIAFDSVDDLEQNPLYHAMAAILGAFRLLARHDRTDPARIGIAAEGWSANLAVLAAGLFKERVGALYLESGAAALSYGSYFYDVNLAKKEHQGQWLAVFDGLSVADRVSAPVFIAAEVNDPLFYPESVMKTLESVPNPGGQLLTAEEIPQNTGLRFFNQTLKGEQAVPEVRVTLAGRTADGTWELSAPAEDGVTRMRLYYSTQEGFSPLRSWMAVEGQQEEGKFSFLLPASVPADADYFVLADGAEGALASSKLHDSFTSPVKQPGELIVNGSFREGTAYWQADCGAALSSDGASLLIEPSGEYGSSAYQLIAPEPQETYAISFSARTDGKEKPIALILQEYDPATQQYGKRRLFRAEQSMTDEWQTFQFEADSLFSPCMVWFQAGNGTETDTFEIKDVSIFGQSAPWVTLEKENGQLLARAAAPLEEQQKAARLILAIYGQDGQLLSVQSSPGEMEGGAVSFFVSAGIPEEGQTARAFLWRGLAPLAQEATCTLP